MKNIIESCSLQQFKEHIEAGILCLQDQTVPVNTYTFAFFVSELNKYIAEEDHPRYLAYVYGGIMNGTMDIRIGIADRFQQGEWIDRLQFSYPKAEDAVKETLEPSEPSVPKSHKVSTPDEPTNIQLATVPTIENFDLEVQNREKAIGRRASWNKGMKYHNMRKFKYTTYTEYVNYVSALFDELAGCTECLNKTLIGAFLGGFSYPECFTSSGKTIRQHLQLRADIELNDEVKKQFQIDWNYFIDSWSDNAICIAQYETADSILSYSKRHSTIDLVETKVGTGRYALTDFGKVIWEHVHEIIGYIKPDAVEEKENQIKTSKHIVVSKPDSEVADTGEVEQQVEEPVQEEETVKVRHMGYSKCIGCAYFNRRALWCDKRQGYINSLEHEECFEAERPELEVAKRDEVEKICYNCKRWHSGNNPGNLKAIACRCPIHGKKTLTDHTCNKFVAVVKKED